MGSFYHKGGAGTDAPTTGHLTDVTDWASVDLPTLLEQNKMGNPQPLIDATLLLLVRMWNEYGASTRLSATNSHLGNLYIKLVDSMPLIAERNIQATDVEEFLLRRLGFVYREYRAENEMTLRTPNGTNADRRKRNKEPYADTYQTEADLDVIEVNDLADYSDEWLAVVDTDEDMICRRYVLGESFKQIADAEQITVYRVKQVINNVRAKCITMKSI